MRSLGSITTLSVLSVLATPAMGDILIDHFQAPPGGVTLTDAAGGGAASTSTANAGILGGWRSTTIQATGTLSATVDINTPGLEDLLAISNKALTSSTTTLVYDANGAGLGDLDLTALGLTTFNFGLVFADADITLAVDLYDGATVASVTIPVSEIPADYNINFSDFTVVGGGDPFSSLDKIVITVSVPTAGDIVIHSFGFDGVVPETSTIVPVLGLLGIAGAQLYRRRRAA